MIDVIQGDLTELDVDALVNAANAELRGGGGVDGAIHRAAGPQLLEACRRLGGCETGKAVLTPGFHLKARFVIHAVGPIWRGGQHGEAEQLASAYDESFQVARSVGTIRSIALPAISTGAYGFPRELATEIATRAIRRNQKSFDRIVACLFDAELFGLYQKALAF